MKTTAESCEVLVVGAGPAGACAARDLARKGIRVILLEKFPLPRYKTCGGGVVGRTLLWMPVDISAAIEALCPVAELRLENLDFSVQRPQPIVTMTMRARLDQLLVDTAESAGAAVLPEHEVVGVTCGEDAVEVRTRRSHLKARFVIAADGATSAVARLAGLGPSPRLIPALEWELPATARLRENFQTARFDFTTSGYGWVFPKKEHLSVGVLDMGIRHHPLKAILNSYREEREIAQSEAPPPRGAAIPIRPRRAFFHQRILLVGDAAGLADPVTGEGISFAVRSGRLAASSLLAGNLEPDQVGPGYGRALNSEILRELRAARLLASLLYGHRRFRRSVFQRYGRRLCEKVTEVLTGKSSYRRLLGDPRNYLGLLRR